MPVNPFQINYQDITKIKNSTQRMALINHYQDNLTHSSYMNSDKFNYVLQCLLNLQYINNKIELNQFYNHFIYLIKTANDPMTLIMRQQTKLDTFKFLYREFYNNANRIAPKTIKNEYAKWNQYNIKNNQVIKYLNGYTVMIQTYTYTFTELNNFSQEQIRNQIELYPISQTTDGVTLLSELYKTKRMITQNQKKLDHWYQTLLIPKYNPDYQNQKILSKPKKRN